MLLFEVISTKLIIIAATFIEAGIYFKNFEGCGTSYCPHHQIYMIKTPLDANE